MLTLEALQGLAADFEQSRKLLVALGDENRQHLILEMMRSGECSGLQVGTITEKTHLSRPAVSHHLQILKDAGLLKVRKEGTKHFYYFDSEQEALGQLIATLQKAKDLTAQLPDRSGGVASFVIRHAAPADLPRQMEIYTFAREQMAAQGNPRQWGATNWPPQALIEQDIAAGKSYICEYEGRVVGTFFFDYGERIEPTYEHIENGAWMGDDTYGVVHRIAADGSVRGIGTACLNWAFAQCGHLRIDTHEDNKAMQNLVAKLGFAYCGHIHVVEDPDIRLAYEKVE